jgi:hypothetical protein
MSGNHVSPMVGPTSTDRAAMGGTGMPVSVPVSLGSSEAGSPRGIYGGEPGEFELVPALTGKP